MAVSVQNQGQPEVSSSALWDSVMEMTKSAQKRNHDPLLWAVQLSSSLSSYGVILPSVELAHLLVSHICWANHVPITWKFLEKALTVKIVPPMLVLALLASRVIPCRRVQPAAYRLYLELLKRHVFLLSSLLTGQNHEKVMKSMDETLHLSQIFGLEASEPGILLVQFIFSIVWQLLDASLDDEDLLELSTEERFRWPIRSQDMEIDGQDSFNEKRNEHNEGLHKVNTAMAIEVIAEFLQNKQTSRILYLSRRNLPSQWTGFIYGLRLLVANSAALRNSKLITPEILLDFTSDRRKILSGKHKTISKKGFHAVMASGSQFSSAGQSHGVNWSSHWLPIDLFLEDVMDGSQVSAISAVTRLTDLVKALQAVNDTSWHNTFLALWIAALQLVQRDRDPSEGPVPRLDTCLCVLLSITTLAITSIIEDEDAELMEEAESSPGNQMKENQRGGKRRKDLITSLQVLGDYDGLLSTPNSISLVANQAAAKAIMLVSGLAVGNAYYECVSMNDTPINCSGNMRHLIVEACIARNLLDTSAYFWPGYVNARSNQIPRSVPGQAVGWSSLMKGASLTPALENVLVATPASSLAELEKIYEIAVNGSDEERISAATILCGASLVRGWNVQEHTIPFITRLLSPPVPPDYSGSESHLIRHAPFLNVLLIGISPVDCVQIFALLGSGPILAGQLMPICEAFGSGVPTISWTLPNGEVLSCHTVFSNAFTLLLRFWRFYQPPIENLKGDSARMGSQLSPEYLLLIRNSRLSSFGNLPQDRLKLRRYSKILNFPLEPIYMDSFPKLKQWHRQHQECIASVLSGLVPGTLVHQIVDALLTMMFRKISRGGPPLTPTTSGSSNNSSGSTNDEISSKLRVPAWDILEACPFVLDAALTACAHGRLSPRELATGLKDLADFLPASLATMVSYFSAEVTRGIWKPAFMNGTDWPSPAANLSIVEQQIKKILAATGIDIPSLPIGGNSPATLPLPLAAFVSLTITYKLEKATDRFLVLVGPALSSLAAGCPWPCMPILTSLWAQKVKRWSDFLIFSASQTIFHHKNIAVIQLLKSCFTSALGLDTSNINCNGGVGALLGHGFGSHLSGGFSAVAPGILYIRVHHSIKNPQFLTEEILSLLMLSVRDIATSGLPKERAVKLKKTKYGMRYGQASLASSMARVKIAASLGASFVWMTGGPNLVQSLIKETLPSFFVSVHWLEHIGGKSDAVISMLGGYALAYFTVLSGAFAWGVDSASGASKRGAKIIGAHLKFLASVLDGKISLGCDWATWRAYVSGLVSLMVECTPMWLLEVDVDVLKRLSKGLKHWDERELALAVLGKGGVAAMGAAAELIIEGGF